MGRPKGSKNKPKAVRTDTTALVRVRMEKQVENAPVTRDSHRGWVNWGLRNDYPLQLSNLYYNSPTHRACIDFATTAVMGDGLDYERMALAGDEMPNYQYSWDTLIECLAKDYLMYGIYAVQVIKNEDGRTYSFFHQPAADVRCSPKDEDGVITSYWICEDWTSVGKFTPMEIPAFGFTDDEEIKKGQAYLYVYSEYSPDLTYYAVPNYMTAAKAIQSESELLRYDLRSVLNNFSASGILTLNNVDDDDEKAAVIANIQAMFTGSDNANSLIINFRNNGDETPAEFTRIDKDAGNNVNLFDQLNARIVSKIVASHRISNKALIGYEADSAMLGGEGNVLSVAWNLYNKTVATRNRKAIVGSLNKMFGLNGIETDIYMKPLSFNLTDTFDSSASVADNIGRKDSDEMSEKQTTENKDLTINE